MKRFLSFAIILAVLLTSAFVIPAINSPDQAYAASKYVKVKRTTYNKYKKAYKTTVPNLKVEIAEQKVVISDLNTQLKEKKQQVSWLWDTLESFGYFYNYDTHRWELQNPEGNNSITPDPGTAEPKATAEPTAEPVETEEGDSE